MHKIPRAAAVTTMALGILAGSAMSASANSGSSRYNYPGGDYIQANVWIQSFSWSGCGGWQSSAYLYGTNPYNASWISDTFTATADGIGASVSGVSASGGSGSQSETWTNYNNWNSSLAGNVCGNWMTWYIEAATKAETYVPQYGAPRSTSVSV